MTQPRRAQVHAPGDVRVVAAPPPPPRGPADLWCRVRAVGVCGTDVAIAREGDAGLDQVPGHEIVAEVVDAPPDSWVAPGARVMIRPIRGCGACWYCRAGLIHQCDRSAELTISYGRPGGYADLLLVDAPTPDEVVAVADGVDDLDAVWAEPLAVALHAVRTAAGDGEALVVIGAGPLGLCAIAAARALGLRVTAIEPREPRRAAALGIGADRVIDPTTTTTPPRSHAVLTTVGSSAALAMAHQICAPGGVVVHAGLGHGATLPDTLGPVTTVGSFGYLPEEFLHSTALINSGKVRLSSLVTHEVRLADIGMALQLPVTDPAAVKVVVRP